LRPSTRRWPRDPLGRRRVGSAATGWLISELTNYCRSSHVLLLSRQARPGAGAPDGLLDAPNRACSSNNVSDRRPMRRAHSWSRRETDPVPVGNAEYVHGQIGVQERPLGDVGLLPMPLAQSATANSRSSGVKISPLTRSTVGLIHDSPGRVSVRSATATPGLHVIAVPIPRLEIALRASLLAGAPAAACATAWVSCCCSRQPLAARRTRLTSGPASISALTNSICCRRAHLRADPQVALGRHPAQQVDTTRDSRVSSRCSHRSAHPSSATPAAVLYRADQCARQIGRAELLTQASSASMSLVIGVGPLVSSSVLRSLG